MTGQMLAKAKNCHYCGEEMASAHWGLPNSATREHIVPKSFGGRSAEFNIVIVCQRCNSKRGSGPSPCGCRKCTLAWYHYYLTLNVVNVPNPIDFNFRMNKNAYQSFYHRRLKERGRA